MFSAVKISAILFTIAYVLANASSGQATQPPIQDACNKIQTNCQKANSACDTIIAAANFKLKIDGAQLIISLINTILSLVNGIIKIGLQVTDILSILKTLSFVVAVIVKLVTIIQALIGLGALLDAILGVCIHIKAYITLLIAVCASVDIKIGVNVIPIAVQILLQLVGKVFVGIGNISVNVLKLLNGDAGLNVTIVINACIQLNGYLKIAVSLCVSLMTTLVATLSAKVTNASQVKSCLNQLGSCSSALITATLDVGAYSVAKISSGLLLAINAKLQAALTAAINAGLFIKDLISSKLYLSVDLTNLLQLILDALVQLVGTSQKCCEKGTGGISSLVTLVAQLGATLKLYAEGLINV